MIERIDIRFHCYTNLMEQSNAKRVVDRDVTPAVD